MASSLQTVSKDSTKTIDSSMLDEYELVHTAQGSTGAYASSSCDETHEDDLSSLTEHTTDDDEDRHSNNDSTTSQKTSGYHALRTSDTSSSGEHPAGESGDDWEDEMEAQQAESNITLQMPAVHGSRELPPHAAALPPTQKQIGCFDTFSIPTTFMSGIVTGLLLWIASFYALGLGVAKGERNMLASTSYANLPYTFGNMSSTLTSLEFHQLSGINTLIVLPLYLRVQPVKKMPSVIATVKREGSNEIIQSKLSPVLDNLFSLDWSPKETWGTLVVQARYKLPGTYAEWLEDAYSIQYERFTPGLKPADFEDMLYNRYVHIKELKGQVLVKLDGILKTMDKSWSSRLYGDTSAKQDDKQPDKESEMTLVEALNKLVKQEIAAQDGQAQAKPPAALPWLKSSRRPKDKVDGDDQSAVASTLDKVIARGIPSMAPKSIGKAIGRLRDSFEKAQTAATRQTQDKAGQALYAISNAASKSIVKTKDGLDGLMEAMLLVKRNTEHGLHHYNKVVKGETAMMALERLKRGTRRAQWAAKVASHKATLAGKDGYVSLKNGFLAKWQKRGNKKMKQVMAAELPKNE